MRTEAQKGTLWPLPLTDWFEGTYWLLEVTGRIERVRMIPGSMGSTQKAQSCCTLDVVINIMSLELIAYGGLQKIIVGPFQVFIIQCSSGL